MTDDRTPASRNRPIHVTVLGGGSRGTSVAALAARKAPTRLWLRGPRRAGEINRQVDAVMNAGRHPRKAYRSLRRVAAESEHHAVA
jgi:glycerol-3-phosphate dehydrogenase